MKKALYKPSYCRFSQFATLVFTLLLLSSNTLLAQHPTCDGVRYYEEVFEEVIHTPAVAYGQNDYEGNQLTLLMDVFEPKDDTAIQRPVIVWVYGGSFYRGSRRDMHGACELFAKRGFVTIAIDYRRLRYPAQDSLQVYDVLTRSVSDLAAAVRYLRKDAATRNDFRIDPDIIIAGGLSAGALIALQLAYLDKDDESSPIIGKMIARHGGLEGNTGNCFSYSSKLQGVINYSGGLKYAHWIDEGEPPLFSAHDDMDPIVPFWGGVSTGLPSTFYLEGSGAMHARLDDLGIYNDIFVVENSTGHSSFFYENAILYSDQVTERTAAFVHQLVCSSP